MQYQTIHNSLLENIQELMNGNLKFILEKIEEIHENIILMGKKFQSKWKKENKL